MVDETARTETTPSASAEPGTALVDMDEPLGSILQNAIRRGATDVHLDPVEAGKRVRLRIDGLLHAEETVPRALCERLLNQVRVAAELRMDRAFHPLEGQFTVVEDDAEHDVRVSILPVGFPREAIHLRFLSAGPQRLGLSQLGLSDPDVALLQETLEIPVGLVVVSGDTGSGKSTTLYGLASALPSEEQVIASIEDPVELHLPGVRQIQAYPEHGLTMYEGLRTLLRADPDVILVGEIRDPRSAVVAARAAMTGHLVLATVHAPSCAVAVEALYHLSVPRYVLSSALRMLVGQHLMRRLRPDARTEVAPDEDAVALFEQYDVRVPDHVYRPSGDPDQQKDAYAGRTGVFELVPVDRDTAHAVGRQLDRTELEDCLGRQARPLLADALRKAADGVLSIDEVKLLARHVHSL